MIIDITPEEEARLKQLAQDEGRSVRQILTETAKWLLQHEAAHEASLKLSLNQADRGEFIDQEEMDARVQKMLQPR
jgi:predicted transcriptional regulator